ncbi:ArnT family glycosyltransferase [Chiayiivirga flava]|uniref:4-amino-4-deoxy-L-arabinose transferase-like glycosyltransferase n=1 Tax=Chiayiivirga flava TaxID=659595 RepID=A0A7W8D688_9GAMM|nr:glycosyltransferase family 39 protein [Chiayiivirga flava]MBB5207481.1 4-amino-4-deoxy-L-arabinose transferase-like glycosyltransferase [Chiayiivirga flava]
MQLITRHTRRDLWIFFGLALLVVGSGIGLRDPWPADEPRFALVARTMVESGDWLFPHRGDELYSDKPPMFMWLQAAAYSVLREWRIAFLLPSLLAALGTLWLTYDIGRRLRGHSIGLYGGYALLFALQFAWQFKKAQIDPVVVFFITLANWGLLQHFLLGPDTRRLYLGWFAAGLGTITKGVGAIALLMGLPYLFARWRGWRGLAPAARGHAWVAAPLLFVAAAALWLLPMLLAVWRSDDPALHAYADDILLRQTAERYAKSWDHHQPAWYFVQVALTMWMPLVLALPWALPAWWRRLRRRDARTLLPLAWVLLVLLFFSIPDGKRDLYILPALPMFCVALGPLLPGLLRKRALRWLVFGFVVLFGLVPLAAGTAALLGEPRFESRLALERGFAADFYAPWWMLATLGAAVLACAAWFRPRRAIAALLCSLTLAWCVVGLWAQPMLDASSSARELMQDVGRLIGPDAELGLVAWREQNLLQADRPATTFGFKRPFREQKRAAIAWLAEAPSSRRVLIQETAMGDCVDPARAVRVGQANRRTWWVFGMEAVTVSCRPAAGDPAR